MVMVTPLMVGT